MASSTTLLILFLAFSSLSLALACPSCPNPPPTPHPHPPHVPKPPVIHPPPVKPPPIRKPCPPPPPPPETPCPPLPPPETPCPPPPRPPVAQTCPSDTVKVGACVDVLVHVGVGEAAKEACCPVLEGIGGLNAALCLCTTIREKLLEANLIIPIALQLLLACGKAPPPPGFQCPSS